jgi:hypothetical protein
VEGKSPGEQLIECRRQIGIHPGRLERLQVRVEEQPAELQLCLSLLAPVGWAPGEQLVQDRADRVNVTGRGRVPPVPEALICQFRWRVVLGVDDTPPGDALVGYSRVTAAEEPR